MNFPRKIENLKFAQSMLKEISLRMHAADEQLLTYLVDMAYHETSDRIRSLEEEERASER